MHSGVGICHLNPFVFPPCYSIVLGFCFFSVYLHECVKCAEGIVYESKMNSHYLRHAHNGKNGKIRKYWPRRTLRVSRLDREWGKGREKVRICDIADVADIGDAATGSGESRREWKIKEPKRTIGGRSSLREPMESQCVRGQAGDMDYRYFRSWGRNIEIMMSQYMSQ